MRRKRYLAGVLLGACVGLAGAAEVPPLFTAAGAGDKEAVESLVAAGADPEGRVASGATAMIIAAQNGYLAIVQVLLDAGAEVNATTVGEPVAAGRTALHFAAQDGHQEVVKTLIAHDASVNARTGQGYTPLILAAEGGHVATIRVLLKTGADIEARNMIGTTPLIGAALKNHSDAAILLLELGAEPDATSDNGFSALMLAAYHGNQRIVEALIANDADVNRTDPEQNTALDYATMKRHSAVQYLLLAAGGTAKRTGLEFGEEQMAGKVAALTDESITVVAPEHTRTFLIGPDTKLCADGRETKDLTRFRNVETVSVFTGMNERTARRIDDQGLTMNIKDGQWVTVMPECVAGE
ncbi:MAG: ankyrin repeat domain-containing protein [Gammaproteobacteria bacterium]